jgi:hypothetical protein
MQGQSRTTAGRPSDAESVDTLREIHRRLVSIHVGLEEGPRDPEIWSRTLERTMALIRDVGAMIDKHEKDNQVVS